MNRRSLQLTNFCPRKRQRQRCLELLARFLYPLLFLTGFLLVSGCGTSDGRVAVDGTVKVDGKLMDGAGIVSLVPKEDDARTAGGEIKEGKFSIPAKQGPTPGKQYRVEVYWGKPTGRKTVDPESKLVTEEFKEGLPAKYNKASTLTAEFTRGTNRLDLDLKSK